MDFYEHQIKALYKLQNGNILLGGVGSGKSRTSLAYYYIRICNGQIPINGNGYFSEMKNPIPLYIITTAKKRDSHEWELECNMFGIHDYIVDSWNNIEKYKDITNAFIIFDEQRVVGYGKWSKTFIKMSKANKWILLTATPGDTWMDYIPVFIANGFYKNKTEFIKEHVIFNQFVKYQKVDRYIGVQKLIRLRNQIIIPMLFERHTHRNTLYLTCDYDKSLYDTVLKKRWDPFKDEPIKDIAQVSILLRKIVNTHESRLKELYSIYKKANKVIVFYNFNVERDLLISFFEKNKIIFSEWNGHKHQEIPKFDKWIYLVQYTSGAEGWNCIETNTIIFYSQNYSYKMTEQAAGRIDRINTPFKELYYYILISDSSIDKAIKRAHDKKENFNYIDFFNHG